MRTFCLPRETAVIVMLALHVGVTSCGRAPALATQKQALATDSCELLVYNREDTEIILRVKNKDMIADLVNEPLSRAKENPNPADYVALGTLTLHKSNGNRQVVHLYRPWGNIKVEETYYTCGLDGLKTFLMRTLDRASVNIE
jgi:hypothetical protein